MSNISNEIPANMKDTTQYKWYAFVCDGEVATIEVVSVLNGRKVAVLSSSPTIVPIEPDQAKIGDLYTNGTFTQQS